ncbi:MAG TPA: hypothetical protein VHD33_03965 [Legionellaceae bacterium]|nr:hypothetical protein [Legionellaceae bacterium]
MLNMFSGRKRRVQRVLSGLSQKYELVSVDDGKEGLDVILRLNVPVTFKALDELAGTFKTDKINIDKTEDGNSYYFGDRVSIYLYDIKEETLNG